MKITRDGITLCEIAKDVKDILEKDWIFTEHVDELTNHNFHLNAEFYANEHIKNMPHEYLSKLIVGDVETFDAFKDLLLILKVLDSVSIKTR